MKNDFTKRNDRKDVSPFRSVFFYITLQYCLSVSMCVLCTYSQALWAQAHHHLDLSYSHSTLDFGPYH